jgi:hypothetical protein
MRLAYILLGMFLLFAGLRVKARELTTAEALALVPLKKTQSVKLYMEEELGERRLNFSQAISFRALKLSCRLIEATVAKIDNAADDYPEQVDSIFQNYALCSEGTLGLTQLYIKTRPTQETYYN